ncbi:ABC transporter permease [Desulfotomaculum sp. 1211_IL3151]|uniref:ABC transporter permease n=1 Tax=Desulfotomaculum sp. 1211_IL3151 TaxID=3084055 RepID=UPI002FD8B047
MAEINTWLQVNKFIPSRGSNGMLHRIKEIYMYREMLKNLVKRDLRTRYKGSALGFLWTFINPLLQLVVYSFLFSTILRMNVEKYPMFLFVALLPWVYLATTTQVGANLIIANNNMVKKIYFPREILPISIAVSGFINLALSLLVAMAALLVFKIPLTINLVALPIVMVIQFFFTLGVTFIISSINVYMRDIEHLWGIFVMAWFYITPIVYPMEMVPNAYQKYFFLNPAALMVSAYRDILYRGVFPNLLHLISFFILSVIILGFGYYLFKRLEKDFAEVV